MGCNSATDSGSDNAPAYSEIKANGIVFSLSVPTAQFQLSDTLKATFQVVNESMVEWQFNFGHMQQNGFQLVDGNGTVALLYPIIVSPALSSFRLQPGEKKEYSIKSLFRNHHDGQYLARGEYTMSAFLLENKSPYVSLTIHVR